MVLAIEMIKETCSILFEGELCHQKHILRSFFTLYVEDYTWKSSRDNNQQIVPNQIDYMLRNKRHQNSIKTMAAYPSVDIGSDYNPLIGTLKFRRKQVTNRNEKKAYDISSLNDIRKREILKDELDKHIKLSITITITITIKMKI